MKLTNEIILKVDNLSNTYADEPLLQDINFSLLQGEILCLLGPSGSGKTTLLRLLAGLEQEDTGKIIFCGRDVKPIPPYKRNIGMMFQEYALFPHKNVWQNISFGLEMHNFTEKQRDQKIKKLLDLVGLTGLERRQIDELSGGEKQRVALARSLAPQPRLLLLDEPLGSLDRSLRDRLTIEIREILKELGVTAVFVTHDQAEAFSVADKVAILHNGRLQQFDTPEQIYFSPANRIVAGFLGFKNLIEGKIKNGIFQSELKEITIAHTENTAGRSLLLIRPDAARLVAEDNNVHNLTLTGIIESRIFQGSSYKVEIQTHGINLCFDLPISPAPPTKDQSIDLFLNPSALVLIQD